MKQGFEPYEFFLKILEVLRAFSWKDRNLIFQEESTSLALEDYSGMAKKPSNPNPVQAKVKAASDKASPAVLKAALGTGSGILRLAPTWVPRSFLMPGRRLKLATQDLYAYGAQR